MTTKLVLLGTVGLFCLVSFEASAWVHRHRQHHQHYYHDTGEVSPPHPVTIGYGETIIDGRTGLHRSDFGVMVPDGTGANFVLSGRRSGSGLGANGLPGSNLDNE